MDNHLSVNYTISRYLLNTTFVFPPFSRISFISLVHLSPVSIQFILLLLLASQCFFCISAVIVKEFLTDGLV